MDGILIIDKPVGLTSHDVVARVRRILKEKRVGHTGTLDPFATGVLVVLIGRATRLAQFLSGAVKEYAGVIRFGFSTDTGDATGTPVGETGASMTSQDFAGGWNEATVAPVLAALSGEIEQIPPMYSAKKVEGKKLYELARKGEKIDRAAVKVNVYEFEMIKADESLLIQNTDGTCDLEVRVVCSAGTYIRTLAESVGEKLGVPAHLAALRRTRAGDFRVSESISLTDLEQLMTTNGDAGSVVLPLRAALSDKSAILLDDQMALCVRHGAMVHSDDHFVDGEFVQLCDANGELIAVGVYNMEQESLHPRVVLG